jgi:hypothetical protein
MFHSLYTQTRLLTPYMPGIVAFLEAIAACESKDESVLRHAIGVVGDIAHSMGPQAKSALKHRPLLQKLVQEGVTQRYLLKQYCPTN